MKHVEKGAGILIILIVVLAMAGMAWAGVQKMIERDQAVVYYMPSTVLPITAVGNYPSDDGYCPADKYAEGAFDSSVTHVFTTGTADITVTAQHGIRDASGATAWQNATDAHLINGTTALINSTHKFTNTYEFGECWRLNVSAGVDAVGNQIDNTTTFMQNK